MTKPILTADRWPTNAELIADVAVLHLERSWKMLDPTFGKGVWWKKWCPAELVTHDIVIDEVDFRDLPHDDQTFDAVAYDPPYVSVGGRATTKLVEMYERYGLTEAASSPEGLQAVINEGLAEMYRVVRRRRKTDDKPGGVVLVKCQNYISSGRLFLGKHHTIEAALKLGFDVVDIFTRVGAPRPQPPRTRADGTPSRQHHARNNTSDLIVLQRK